jgi:hypothetical protein
MSEEAKTPEELTKTILKVLGKENAPEAILIEDYLTRNINLIKVEAILKYQQKN